MATRIQSITVHGFGVFAKPTVVKFDKRGRVLVTGVNRDTESASSNGAGKTTIFKALTWGLYGKTVDGLTTDVIHRRCKKATVEVVFAGDDDTRYAVKRERTPKTGKLTFTRFHPGPTEDMTQSKAAATQAAIEETLGMDLPTFRSTVLFGQGDHGRFASRDLGDAARKEILGRVLDLDQYRIAREEMVKRRASIGAEADSNLAAINDSNVNLGHIDTDIARLEGKLTAMRDPASLIESADELDTKKAVKEVAQATHEEQAQAAQELLDEAVLDLDDVLRVIESTAATEKKYIARVSTMAADLKRLEDMKEATTCPTCGQSIPDAHEPDPAQLSKALQALQKAEKNLGRAKGAMKDLNAEAGEIRLEVRTLERKVANAQSDAREAGSEAKRHAERAVALREEATRATADREEVVKQLDFQRECRAIESRKLDDLLETSDEINRRQIIANWWVNKGLGPKGVPAFAIEQALPYINARANKHLIELADGDISVRWSALTTGSTGKVKEELSQHVRIEGIDDVMPSGGQQKKIELATELALAELANDGRGPMNLLLLDEALDGLDQEGGRRVCQWLEGLGAESIFVVTHDAALAEDFDRIIVVEKVGGESTIEGGE